MLSNRNIIFALVLAVCVWGYLRTNNDKNDRQYLLGLPDYVAGLAEKKQVAEIKRLISPQYADLQGRTIQDLNLFIMAYTSGGEISIYTLNPQVDLEMSTEPWTAKLHFKAAMARGPKQAKTLSLPESASVYEFSFQLEKTAEGWLVKSGSWNPATWD